MASSPSSPSNVIDLYREYYLNQSSDELKNGLGLRSFKAGSLLSSNVVVEHFL
ncbi:MAG TPA: hypothetical protein VGW09_09600 [Nitrososphaeraceae archaeon]|nr:hypothetical protein [Nitrososphaeraceae archaeon]